MSVYPINEVPPPPPPPPPPYFFLFFQIMRCQLCEEYVPNWDLYRSHLNNRHRTTITLRCQVCTLEVEHRDELKRHLSRFHKHTKFDPKYARYETASRQFATRWWQNRSRIVDRGARKYRRRHDPIWRRPEERRPTRKGGDKEKEKDVRRVELKDKKTTVEEEEAPRREVKDEKSLQKEEKEENSPER